MFLDYCAEQQNDHMATFREQGEISNICQFCWYEWVYTRYISEPLPHMAEVIGICLGPSNNEGKKMTQWVLNINGQVVPRRSLHRLRTYELSSEFEISKRVAFNAQIKLSHGKSFTVPAEEHTPNPQDSWDE